MITGELRSKVDSIWDTIWTGGITSPITVLEQVTYLMFMKLLDDNQLMSSMRLLLHRLSFWAIHQMVKQIGKLQKG